MQEHLFGIIQFKTCRIAAVDNTNLHKIQLLSVDFSNLFLANKITSSPIGEIQTENGTVF